MHRIHLTFDDGPDPDFTPRVLDVLGEAGMRATFFAIGKQARRFPELIRRAVAEGHEVANHSFSHRHPWFVRERTARAEVRECAEVLSDVLGQRPRFFRPPHGRRRACMDDEARRLGAQTVLWHLSAIDWGPFGRADRIEKRLERIRPNDIVLMHDGKNEHNRPDELLRVLPQALRHLQTRGLHSALLGNVPDQPSTSYVPVGRNLFRHSSWSE
ncbi:MAG: polysaccharide deacetylase family protein [Xanthomonadaceae bacterium]|nr:polysaccharide deacetylase family protein [Xanthomonadaceae bacterium]